MRPGATYATDHEMDLAASPDRRSVPGIARPQEWPVLLEVDYRIFRPCAEELYRALLNKSRTLKAVNTLGADTE